MVDFDVSGGTRGESSVAVEPCTLSTAGTVYVDTCAIVRRLEVCYWCICTEVWGFVAMPAVVMACGDGLGIRVVAISEGVDSPWVMAVGDV